MATLKDHQKAMVDLLASGSGIPASASRLAHAMHDVLSVVMAGAVEDAMQQSRDFAERLANDATTPGLNDKALAADVAACKPQWLTATEIKLRESERRVKELENTIRQLKANLVHERACVAELRGFLHEAQDELKRWGSCAVIGEQAGCRKPDTQVCEHIWIPGEDVGRPKGYYVCSKCGATEL